MFRARLNQIINLKHELVQLAGKINWEWIDGEIAPLFSDKGRPATSTRFVIGLLLLKHIFALSDEQVCERWVYDPYFQYSLTGAEFFQHVFPHERSDLSHWRNRLGDELELLLAESLRIAHETGALQTNDLARVTVDTTVQPKPTDAKLLRSRGSIAWPKSTAAPAILSAHRQARRLWRGAMPTPNSSSATVANCTSCAAGLVASSATSAAGQADIEAGFQWPLARANQIRSQQQRQRGWKLYSFHAPEVECIGKGMASAPYEFGVKASIVTTNARARGGQFVLHAKALPGNPYDGHTLGAGHQPATEKLTGCQIARAFTSIRDTAAMTNPRRVSVLQPEARRVRRHQTRTATAFRHGWP